MQRVLLVVACLVGMTSAWFFNREPDWNGLRVTFGLNPFKSFKNLPRTENDAKEEGWTKIADCDNNSTFRGVRYMKRGDPAVILLFDVKGHIAGIQCGIPKAEKTANYPPSNQVGNIFQDDGDRLTLTAYFTDPATICTTGRSDAEFEQYGTGTGLYIQIGSNPVSQSVRIADKMDQVDTTHWTKGYCFVGMGVHYWYNVSKDMNCNDFQPVFLLYNKNKLNAFGWALGMDRQSDRFEHPPLDKIGSFINPVPTCLSGYGRLSTMHIYLTHRPYLNWC